MYTAFLIFLTIIVAALGWMIITDKDPN